MNKLEYQLLRKARRREIDLITGASGAGKSQLMTGLIAKDLMRYHLINTAYHSQIGTYNLPKPLCVWSNYPISFWYRPSDDGAAWAGARKLVLLETKQLDVEQLYTFHPEMREGKVYIDELDLLADKQDWQNGGQKLLMAILRQLRKPHMSMTAALQSESWLNPRFLFHIDVVVGCRDAAVTAWGQTNSVDDGDMTFLSLRDRSGLLTGYTFEETGEVIQAWFRGKAVQKLYDTDYEFDIANSMVSYGIKRKRKEINFFHAEEEQEAQDSADLRNTAIASMLAGYVEQGETKLKISSMVLDLKNKGITTKRTELLEHLETVHNVAHYKAMGYEMIKLTDVTNLPKAKRKAVAK